MKINMSSPDLTDSERQAVMAVVNTPNLSMGPQINAFEDSFRSYSGLKHAVGVSSGTAGLHLCIRAAGIKPGDLVLTTPFSFVASANVILYEGAVPVFVDVEPDTGNINPDLVRKAVEDINHGTEKALTWLPCKGASPEGKLKAILAVDVFGQPVNMDPLRAICNEYELSIIEDSCEALGAEYKNKKAGTLGDYGVFAFYPNKQITTGEGGMIITNNDQSAELMLALRNQGRAPGDTWLQHTYLGYNYRMDEMSAAMGVVQMSRLEELLTSRQQVAEWYQERLGKIEGITPPVISPNTSRVSWFVYVIQLYPGIDREKTAHYLESCGIPVRPYFLPIHKQPYFIEKFGYQTGNYPITEDLGERCLALPFSGKMSEEQVAYVCQNLADSIQ